MPTYEYVCAKCHHHFDVMQSITAKPLTVCPKDLCPKKTWGKGKVKHAISAGAGLIFKGSGFYITDYRSDKYKAAASKDTGGSSSSSGEKTGGEKKETKSPAASTPAKPSTPSSKKD